MSRSALLLLLALALAACGSSSSRASDPAAASQGGGPTAHTEAEEPEPAATTEPPAADPEDDGREPLEVLTGRASYYSDRLAGRHTANGDVYDPTQLTAASRDLPFGTRVRVVRVDTGASVVVRVNDRGPHRDHSRILDLSRAAAERLDMMRAGVIEIRAEILERPE